MAPLERPADQIAGGRARGAMRDLTCPPKTQGKTMRQFKICIPVNLDLLVPAESAADAERMAQQSFAVHSPFCSLQGAPIALAYSSIDVRWTGQVTRAVASDLAYNLEETDETA